MTTAQKKAEYAHRYYLKHQEALRLRERLRHHANREKANQRRRLRYVAHRDDELAVRNRYWVENREERRAYNRRYWLRTKERQKARSKAWRIANAEAIREKNRIYQTQNLDKTRVWQRKWKAKNQGKLRAYDARRRALELNAPDADGVEQFYVFVRNQRAVNCNYCGVGMAGSDAHIDHIVPLTRGGTHSPENLCVACPRCNRSKGNRLLSEWMSGRTLMI